MLWINRRFVLATLLGISALDSAGRGGETMSISDLRRLPREQAGRGETVRVSGVVTWHNPSHLWGFIVDDGKEGIYCDVLTAVHRGVVAPEHGWKGTVKTGRMVEIEGAIDAGNYSPVILPRSVKVVKETALPEAKEITCDQLFSGSMDSQRVSLRCVVQDARRVRPPRALNMEAATMHGSFQILLMDAGKGLGEDYIGAEVMVSGCVLPLFNSRAEQVGVSVETSRMEDVQVLRAPPEDPFDVPLIGLRALRPFAPDVLNLMRQKVRGVLTAQRPGAYLFLQEEDRAVQVFFEGEEVFMPGDVVEAAGFVDFRSPVGALRHAVCRKTGTGPVPEARPVTVERLMRNVDDAARQLVPDTRLVDDDCALVSLEGTVKTVEGRGPEVRVTLASGDKFVPLSVNGTLDDPALREVQVGAVVRATGVALLSYKAEVPTNSSMKPSGAFMVLRSLRDIAVIRRAPWVTPERMGWVLGLAGAVVLMLVAWGVSLRRMVAALGNDLFVQKRAMRDVEIEKDVTLRERHRLSGELHDSLQQIMAATCMQMNSASAALPEDPRKARQHLEKARHGGEVAQQELRRCLFGLREVMDSPLGLNAALRLAADTFRDWRGAVIQVSTRGVRARLPRHVTAGLILLTQEAVGNALKHGQAQLVKISAEQDKEGLRLTIQDNGVGFETSNGAATNGHSLNGNHYGLSGMAARMRRLGGALDIHSEAGKGTTVSAFISQAALHEEGVIEIEPERLLGHEGDFVEVKSNLGAPSSS